MPGANKDWMNKVILLKLETTEGTDSVPTSAANALQVLNFQPTFMDADTKVRNIETAYFGADPVALAAFKRGAKFDMEIAGGGTATTVPPWMVPLQIAGFGTPTVGGSSVTIVPITSSIKSASSYWYIDDFLMQAIGGRANVGFKIEDDEYPMLNFDYMGRPPTTLAAQAVPTAPTISGYTTPVLATTENTTFTLASYAVGLRRWEMSGNVDLAFRSLIGQSDRVNYRDRRFAGSIVAEVPDLTAKDYFANIRPGTTMAVSCVHGTVVGNIVTIACPKLQISGNVELSEEQGKLMMTMPVTALPTSGNDEISFVTA